jgi:hypothetical protein
LQVLAEGKVAEGDDGVQLVEEEDHQVDGGQPRPHPHPGRPPPLLPFRPGHAGTQGISSTT